MPRKTRRRPKCERCGGKGKQGLFGPSGLGICSFKCPHCKDGRIHLAVTPEMENSRTNSTYKVDEQEVTLQSGIVCFFAIMEGAMFLWVTICFFAWIGSGDVAPFVFLVLGCLIHCCTQCLVSANDPGTMASSLDSYEKRNLENKDAACIIDDLQSKPPLVEVCAEGYHMEVVHLDDQPNHSEKHEVVDSRYCRQLKYTSWKDISGELVGLEGSSITKLEVAPKISCNDEATLKKKQELAKEAVDACKNCESTRSYDKVTVPHHLHKLEDSLVVVTRSPGVAGPLWMNGAFYHGGRFALPGVGALFRLIFLNSVASVRFELKKLISIEKQEGPDWSKLEEGELESYLSQNQEATPIGEDTPIGNLATDANKM